MTRNEALKACIDGAKITHPTYYGTEYVEWPLFMQESNPYHLNIWFGDDDDGYEIYQEKESGEIEEIVNKGFSELEPIGIIAKKINELVRAVNEMRKE